LKFEFERNASKKTLWKRHSEKDASKKTPWKRHFKKDTLEKILKKDTLKRHPGEHSTKIAQASTQLAN
jgi:hypothetical protein